MADRLSRDKMLMHIAFTVAQRGTCSRLQVGAVFSRDGRIIVTGYNGAPAGLEHCDHGCMCAASDLQELANGNHEMGCPAGEPCTLSEHAEQNGIAFAAKHGVALDQSELHVTHAPCLACARSVINAGVKRVLFVHAYRKADGLVLLAQAGVEVFDATLYRG